MKTQVSVRLNETETVTFSLALDLTKVAQIISVNHKFKVVMGGRYPNHYIPTLGLSKQEIANVLD